LRGPTWNSVSGCAPRARERPARTPPPGGDCPSGAGTAVHHRPPSARSSSAQPAACQPEGLGDFSARLGVVPGALYPPRPQQGAALRPCPRRRAGRGRLPGRSLPGSDRAGHRARATAAGRPGKPSGIAALLRTRDPLSPHSLALAEAFLTPLHAAGLPERQAALAFRLIYDYTLGFALSDRTSASEQRLQDTATRHKLHAFLRSLPADRFPCWPPSASTSD
jgi:Tetracyclin repressor-like, C-terminal domain